MISLVKDDSGENLLGRVPLIHIRNQIIGEEIYGCSDIQDILDLNLLLNAKLRRFGDDVDYCGDPVTLVYGANLKSLERGAGKVWAGIPKDGKVENLVLNTDLPAQQRMIEYLNEELHESAGVPQEKIGGVSNTSGTAMAMIQQPITEKVEVKQTLYAPGYSKAMAMALDLLLICDKKYKLDLGLEGVKAKITGIYKKEQNNRRYV